MNSAREPAPTGQGKLQNREGSAEVKGLGNLHVTEILDAGDPDFSAAIRVYAQEFQGKDTGVDPQDFTEEIRVGRNSRNHAYHLWALRPKDSSVVSGMASFFTFPTGGFGGYLILSGPLRGKGFLRELILHMEERMRRDDLGARGWFIECDPRDGTSKIFRRCGFHWLDYPWVQPPLPPYRVATEGGEVTRGETGYPKDAPATDSGPRLDLLYKAWGKPEDTQLPGSAETESFLSCLKRIVYKTEGEN